MRVRRRKAKDRRLHNWNYPGFYCIGWEKYFKHFTEHFVKSMINAIVESAFSTSKSNQVISPGFKLPLPDSSGI